MFHNIFKLIAEELPTAGIDCLLIGGFAVNHYGYTRNTLDIDFMIVAAYSETVRSMVSDAGFINDLKIDIEPICDKFGTPVIYTMIQDQIEALK